MTTKYDITSLDEGSLILVIDAHAGVAVANNRVTHNVYKDSLESFLAGNEADDKVLKEQCASGELFQRTIPGKGVFVFHKKKYDIPLEIYINGLHDDLAVPKGSSISEIKESNRLIAEKYGFTQNPFSGDSQEVLEGLKKLQQLHGASVEDLPITEIKPDSRRR